MISEFFHFNFIHNLVFNTFFPSKHVLIEYEHFITCNIGMLHINMGVTMDIYIF
jgi:hypothetical protein